MSEVKINLVLGDVKNHLHLKDVSEEILVKIVDRFFLSVKQEVAVQEVIRPKLAPLPPILKTSQETKAEKTNKKLPLVDGNRSLSVPLGELLNGVEVEESQPDYYETGIKVRDGVKLYKTRYYCRNKECNDQGNHYLPEGTEVTYCRNCNIQLLVRTATGEFPARDEFGNFYIADRLAPEEQTHG